MEMDDTIEPGKGRDAAADERKLRRKAMRRSWICPGAGFAMIGRNGWAVVEFVGTLLLLVAMVWLAFEPGPFPLWTVLAGVVAYGILWLVEQIMAKRARLQSPGPRFLVSGFVATSSVFWLTVLLILLCLVINLRSLRMAGSGMMPTLEPGERLIYHKRVDWPLVKHGAIIIYTNANDSAWGEPGWIMIARILAGPKDTLSIANGRYVVNGQVGHPVATTGKLGAAIQVPAAPATLVVPDNCYFMVQDHPAGSYDSRVLSWARKENIVSNRLWRLSGRGFLQRVE